MKQKVQKNQEQGLAHLGLIVVSLLVVAAIAFGGWWVWENEGIGNKTQSKNSDLSPSDGQESKKQGVVAPEGWKFYENNETGFNFYYPPEWGEVQSAGPDSWKFSEQPKITFQANRRNKEHTQGHFGVQKDNVVDVSTDSDGAEAAFVTGIEPPTDTQNFSSQQIKKRLSGSHACVLDEISIYEAYIKDPELINSYVYFAYCGLLSRSYGAVAFSSDSLDTTLIESKEIKDNLIKLLETFETI